MIESIRAIAERLRGAYTVAAAAVATFVATFSGVALVAFGGDVLHWMLICIVLALVVGTARKIDENDLLKQFVWEGIRGDVQMSLYEFRSAFGEEPNAQRAIEGVYNGYRGSSFSRKIEELLMRAERVGLPLDVLTPDDAFWVGDHAWQRQSWCDMYEVHLLLAGGTRVEGANVQFASPERAEMRRVVARQRRRSGSYA